MNELIEIAFSPVNALLSMMCILLILYWLLTILTGIDLDFFDVDFDAATDFDLDADIDGDIDNYNPDIDLPNKDANAELKSDSIGTQFLRYFNFDELPLMFLLSVLFFSMWFLSVNATHYLGWQSTWQGGVLLIPILIISLFITKIVTKPLVRLYQMINHKGEEEIDFLGRHGIIKASVESEKLGQIEILVKGDPIRLNVKGFRGISIDYGAKAIIVNESKDKKYYLVDKFTEL